VTDLILSAAEVAALTGYKRGADQARELAAMGIPYRRTRGGPLRVIRAHAEALPSKMSMEPQVRAVR
jgi:hypothetical protein